MNHLDYIGVKNVDWVMHTHHHRDQCQGTHQLATEGIPIAVPMNETSMFEFAESFWKHRRVLANYNVRSDFDTLIKSVPVNKRLRDFERFRWHDMELTVLPTPGHTMGSVSLMANIDGLKVLFSGDLINGHGSVHHLHDMQWDYYSETEALNATISSVKLLKDNTADLILPSHGDPIEKTDKALGKLIGNLSRLFQAVSYTPPAVESPKLSIHQSITQVSRHLWMNSNSYSNFYAVVSDEGQALLMDYGYPSANHSGQLSRFAEHSIRELIEVAGVSTIDVVIPSHYHSDHVAGIPYLQERFGTEVWAHSSFSDILENPRRYNLPVLNRYPINVDRVLQDREEVQWNNLSITMQHSPGHTNHAAQLFTRIDGLKIAHTGDNIRQSLSGPRLGGPIYRNGYYLGAFAKSLNALLAFEPQMILTGHSGAMSADRAMLEDLLKQSTEIDSALSELILDSESLPAALDTKMLNIYPYWAAVKPGQSVHLSVTLHNHKEAECHFHIEPQLPSGWRCEPALLHGQIQAAKSIDLNLRLIVPPSQQEGRKIPYCLNLTLDEQVLGQKAEGLVNIEQ